MKVHLGIGFSMRWVAAFLGFACVHCLALGPAESTIGTFRTLPKEIDGGACTFYLSQKDKVKGLYVLVNDMGEYAFMSINGKVQKFTLKEYNKDRQVYYYVHPLYSLQVKMVKVGHAGRDALEKRGELELTDTSGVKLVRPILGGCED